MNTDTGEIKAMAEWQVLYGQKLPRHIQPMRLVPTPAQMLRQPPRVGRNDPCPCGSGRKFKRCCCTA